MPVEMEAKLKVDSLDATRDRLRAYGLFSEIVSWKLRFFVPTDASGGAVLTRLLDTYAIERVSEREAA